MAGQGSGSRAPKAADRTYNMFAPEHVAEVPQTDLAAQFGLGRVRVVHWKILSARPCLVRCEQGERTIERIRELTSICGRSCADAAGTSGVAPKDNAYCATCLAGAGRSVLG